MLTKTSNVRTTIISSDDLTHTYEVKKELRNEKGELAQGKDAVLVGMYPTITAEEPYKTDLSTMHLLNNMEALGLRSVRIVNLFSRVCSAKLSARGLEVDQKNMGYIEGIMKEESFPTSLMILAWGNSMATCQAANLSKARISNLFGTYYPKGKLYQLTAPGLNVENQEPVHVLYLGIRHKNEDWSIEEYQFPEKSIPVVTGEPKVKGAVKRKARKDEVTR